MLSRKEDAMSFFRIAILLLTLLSGTARAADLGSARISLIKGDVQIYTADTQEWVAASINMPLQEGDRLWVPEGARSEVQLQGDIFIRLGSATSFDILALQEESFQFYLNGGHAYINNRKGGVDYIQVDTPLSSVGCYDNSLVMIDVAENGATDVAVIKGYAAAETRSGKTRVESGSELHIGSDMMAELSPLAPPDEWENWNREQDKKLAAGNRSLRYIPEELDDYAYEFDDYGKWVYVTDYGYCWTPLRVAVDWAPYRVGRWCWVGGNYVWISYEPWGWVPFHYGRWAFVANFGWCWVPPPPGGIYWAPGYVGWVHTASYVAWVPLAPGEIYYGRGYYGPLSVNITNVTINQTVIRNFRNVNVRNAVTVVNHNAFISGRREPVRFKGNPFREANITVGPPVIKPTRDASRPVIRNIPAARKPPERVRRVNVNEIKRERALVREEKGSVFKTQHPGTEMPVKKKLEPQNAIRQQHPPLPAVKPGKKSPFTPRLEQQPPKKTPETIRGRPMPPAAKPSPSPQQPQTASPDQSAPQTRGISPGKPQREPRWQEPTPALKPGAQRQGTPSTVPAGQGLPAGTPGTQRPHTSPQTRPRQPLPGTEAPAQPHPQQTAPRTETPPQPAPHSQTSPRGEDREQGPAPRPREEKGTGGRL